MMAHGLDYLNLGICFTDQGDLTGSTNLMTHYCLEHAYNKISGKKLKEELSAFLPNLPGNIDTPGLLDNRLLTLHNTH